MFVVVVTLAVLARDLDVLRPQTQLPKRSAHVHAVQTVAVYYRPVGNH